MSKAYLGLGTNIGDRLMYLNSAVDILNKNEDICVIKKSKIYETKAWGYTEQADFLNMNLEIETSLTPYELLKECNKVEECLHRERIIRWGPRTIDVDILIYDDIVMNEEDLTIPHPRITQRAFVMYPLIDLNENLTINKKTIKGHLLSLTKEERDEVKEFIGDEN